MLLHSTYRIICILFFRRSFHTLLPIFTPSLQSIISFLLTSLLSITENSVQLNVFPSRHQSYPSLVKEVGRKMYSTAQKIHDRLLHNRIELGDNEDSFESETVLFLLDVILLPLTLFYTFVTITQLFFFFYDEPLELFHLPPLIQKASS